MALPIQLHYQLDRDQTREIYMIVGGKKEKKLYFWMFGFLAFGFLCNILYIITTRTRVGSGQNTFMGADWQSIMSSAFVIVVCVCLALFYHAFSRRRREEMIDLLEQQFSDNTIVLGAESFRYRSVSSRPGSYDVLLAQSERGQAPGSRVKEIYLDYEKLYEAHENDHYFLLITGKQEYVPIPKSLMKREDFAALSRVLTRDLGQWFIKNGRPNVEVEMQKVFGLTEDRSRDKK